MQGCGLFTPAVTRGFGLAQLETVLKSAMQASGVDGQPSVLLIEDHHVTSDDILETINSLLSAGKRCARPVLRSFGLPAKLNKFLDRKSCPQATGISSSSKVLFRL